MVHVEGQVGGRFIRESTRTRTWGRAQKMVDKANTSGQWISNTEPDHNGESGVTTVKEAYDTYINGLGSKSVRNLLPSTVSKHRTVLKRMENYATRLDLTRISQLDVAVLLGFQETWSTEYGLGSEASRGYITKLRKFGKTAVKKNWWPRNYALDLEYPEEDYSDDCDPSSRKRKPLEEEEMQTILEKARTIQFDVQQQVTNWEAETFILVMRWSGMAIINASLLQAHEVVGDTIVYYRKKLRRCKNKIRVEVPIPKFLQERLAQIKRNGLHQGKYYFCRGSVKNPTDVWNERLGQIFHAAGIKDQNDKTQRGDPLSHRFRHTFAAYLLNTEMDLGNGERGYLHIADVAQILGHANQRTTFKYCGHIIDKRINRLCNVIRAHFVALTV